MDHLSLENKKFLIIDANYHNFDILKTIARNFRVKEIEHAWDTSEAVKKLKESHIDFIILDWTANEDNIHFMKTLRDPATETHFIHIIASALNPKKEEVMSAIQMGTTAFLSRPYSILSFKKCIHRIQTDPRPYIRTTTYFGPDRRNYSDEFEGEEKRVTPVKQEDLIFI